MAGTMNRPASTPQPEAAAAGLALAMQLANEGRFPEAMAATAEVSKRFPGHAGARYLQASLLHAAGRPAEALEAFAIQLQSEFRIDPRARPYHVVFALADMVARAPVAVWTPRLETFATFGLLFAGSSPDEHERAFLLRLGQLRIVPGPDAERAARIDALCSLVGFDQRASASHMHWTFEHVAQPWIAAALQADDVGLALLFERAIYMRYVKHTETEAHFAAAFSRWQDGMRELGARFAGTLPPVCRGEPGPRPRIAFFIHNITTVAHAQICFEMLEGHAGLSEPLFEPHVFCFTAEEAGLRALAASGVPVTVLFASSADHRLALARLREECAVRGIDLLVWVSLAIGMPLAFAMRLAPRQAWWALKYHALELPEIDGYVTGGGLEGGTKEIGGRRWRAGPVASTDWVVTGRDAEAAALRERLGPCSIVYGCFGREEKMTDPAFLDALVALLHAVPDARFLWTGRHQHAGLQARFDAAGVSARCHFIGWVDTRLYAQVIDVFLDSFPFPCGLTLYEAMAAGRPVVLFDSPAARDTGIHALVGPLLDSGDPDRENARVARAIFRPPGEDLYLRAQDAQAYVAHATRLALDPAFRMRAGEAGRAFVERFLTDRARAARIYAGHFLDILADRPA